MASSIPRPFADGHRDGYTLMLWKEPAPAQLDALLERIRQGGARHLQIPYLGCQSAVDSADVGACVLERPGKPLELARRAMMHGLTVSFLPIVGTPDWKWRGLFDPKDPAAWFKSYGAWLRKIARDARSLGMTELVVGTEFSRLYRYEDAWRRLISEVRTEFEGAIVLTANWNDLSHGFWDAADAIGVSAYFPLSQSLTPSQEELDEAWRKRRDELLKLSVQWGRPIHLTEVGYPSVASAARDPWGFPSASPSDLALQARCFDAFRKAWEKEGALTSARIWAVSGEGPSSASFLGDYEPLEKPAEEVLRRFFLARASGG